MTPEDMPPAERMDVKVMRLLSGVSEHGDMHVAELEQDLVQMDTLLAEAISKLVASFMAVHQTVDRQQGILNGLLSDGALKPATAAELEQLRNEIAQQVGAAVTSLQFQDMTSQLIGRMTRHMEGLRAVFGALVVDGTDTPDGGSEGALAVINDISDRVMLRFAELEGVVRSTVNQRHMDSGDIELF